LTKEVVVEASGVSETSTTTKEVVEAAAHVADTSIATSKEVVCSCSTTTRNTAYNVCCITYVETCGTC
jgi:hypothetical protein